MNLKGLRTPSYRSERIFSLCLLALLLVGFTVGAPNVQGQHPVLQKLTLTEVEGLVSHGVPDSTMSNQVERRGISFAPTQAILDSLRAKGAGPLTLAAIARERESAPPTEHPLSPHLARPHPKLTRAELQHLIRIQASDAFIAEQVHNRGIDFPATNAEMSSFGAMGVGPRTLAALRDLVVNGIVQLNTEPGTFVSLDGAPAIQANSSGILFFQDVAPGQHTLILNKDGFHPGQQAFVLSDRQTIQLSAPMQWAGALLTVSVQPSNAFISVTGPASFSGPLNGTHCPPGSYTATASLDGYVAQTRNFRIAPGEQHSESFALVVDPAVLARRLDDARSKLAGGDAAGAEQVADALLAGNPSNPDAAVIVADAAFQLGDLNRFVDAGTKAIRGGKSVTVRAMHAHTVWALSIHPMDLTISESGISLAANPPDNRCKVPPVVAFDLIRSIQVIRNPQHGFLDLHIQYTSKPHGAILHDLDFVPERSQTVSMNQPGLLLGGKASVQEPGNADQTLNGILRLMMMARR